MTDTALPETGSLELALANGRRLLSHDPAGAAEQAREILSKDEHNGDALRLLAKALRQLGRQTEAERVEVQAIESASFDPTLVRAGRAILEDRLGDAEQMLRPYLREHSEDAAAVRLLAEVAGRAGYLDDAEKLLRRALELAPAFTDARMKLATMLCFQNKVEESLATLDELLAFDPDSISGQDSKAATLARIGEYREAARIYEKLLEQSPDYVFGWISYGQMLNTIGRFKDSIAAYQKATALDPTRGEAWWSLANLKAWHFTESDIGAMKAALDEDKIDNSSRVHLQFSLGKALEDAGRYEESFRHYEAGNLIRARESEYRPEKTHELVLRSENTFTEEFFRGRERAGVPDADPIFIVGLPRSGSTLVEQILGSHSSIEGTSELQYVPVIQRTLAKGYARPFPNFLTELGPEELKRLGSEYLAFSGPHRKTQKPYFTDKLPNNWEYLGFILSIIPNAKIVDARRHPMDCCFSSFKQLFSIGQEFTYSLDWIGRYYADYVRMMDHFDRLFPGRVHRVIHEKLIEDPEREIRKLLDYLGLHFDDGCLRFYQNDRAVRTPSAEQVRQPINRQGVGRWRPFEAWLGDLKESLGPVLDAYPNVPKFQDSK